MGYLGAYLGTMDTQGISYTSATDAATAEAIRVRIYTVIEALTPGSLTVDKFIRYRNELGADFDEWAETHAQAAFRRFQVREIDDEDLPETSSAIEERVRTRFEVRVAYPQTHRYGPQNAMDRDDVMNEDWKSINLQVGIYGARNFSGSSNCVIFSATRSTERSGKIDFLVISIDVEYIRSVA